MFRFTIRDVLWLTVGVAMGVGWWAQVKTEHEAARKLEQQHGQMALDAVQKMYDFVKKMDARSAMPVSTPAP